MRFGSCLEYLTLSDISLQLLPLTPFPPLKQMLGAGCLVLRTLEVDYLGS